ncbi:MAG: bifunctional nuclease family protein [Candidatus Rokubacteria bacterium]|nr:bifunctional nuclease family protein [Candidatus Rokubacteria bacterium]
MTLMRVKALRHDSVAQAATLVLETCAGRLGLGFLIPVNEAERLARVLGLSRCGCAPIYDLVADVTAAAGASIAGAVLDAEPDGIVATLLFDDEAGGRSFRCHPADAIALALRSGAPICATPAALSHACPLVETADRPIRERDRIARWLDDVTPSDFSAADDSA